MGIVRDQLQFAFSFPLSISTTDLIVEGNTYCRIQ